MHSSISKSFNINMKEYMYLIYKYKYPLLLKDETFPPFNNQFLHSNILPLQVFLGLLSYGVFSAFFPLVYPF